MNRFNYIFNIFNIIESCHSKNLAIKEIGNFIFKNNFIPIKNYNRFKNENMISYTKPMLQDIINLQMRNSKAAPCARCHCAVGDIVLMNSISLSNNNIHELTEYKNYIIKNYHNTKIKNIIILTNNNYLEAYKYYVSYEVIDIIYPINAKYNIKYNMITQLLN